LSEYVTFRLDGQAYATRIEAVREVVRLAELAVLPGLEPPVAGVLDLRGVSLPVVDIRGSGGDRGDVLVLAGDGAEYGFACDEVVAVVDGDTLPEEASTIAAGGTLPPYVETVLRGPDGPVFLVDLGRMAAPA
jgi:purine-binding chemotaxis protein CheW